MNMDRQQAMMPATSKYSLRLRSRRSTSVSRRTKYMIGRKWVKIGVIAAVADMGGTVLSAGTSGGGVGRRGMDPGFFSLYNKCGIIVIFCRKKVGGAGAIL